MRIDEVAAVVQRLRRSRSDTVGIEVKRSSGGLSESIATTICAFANLPGGGTIILGLDEAKDFAVVEIADIAAQCASLAAQSRTAFDPPVHVDIESVDFESGTLVVAQVHEIPASHKPCVLRRSGRSYLRSFDGDYQMSDLEVQGLISNRTHPSFDMAAVSGATRSDLDETIIGDFLATARSLNSALARLHDDDELLYRSGARTPDGQWTVAGCLTFGRYPQQWFPSLTIQAAVMPSNDAAGNRRAVDTARFDGSVAMMLADASEWIARHLRHGVEQDRVTGAVVDADEYPLLAVREIVANALVHRDLAPWALGRAIEVRLTPGTLTVTNPGGLFGVSAGQLGQHALTSARNSALVRLNQYTHARRQRVIEALASGIPTVFSELRAAGLPDPIFLDQGIAFTVRLQSIDTRAAVSVGTASSSHAAPRVTPAQERLLKLLDVPTSANALAERLHLSPTSVRKQLIRLVEAGLIESTGGRGHKATQYRRGVVAGEAGGGVDPSD